MRKKVKMKEDEKTSIIRADVHAKNNLDIYQKNVNEIVERTLEKIKDRIERETRSTYIDFSEHFYCDREYLKDAKKGVQDRLLRLGYLCKYNAPRRPNDGIYMRISWDPRSQIDAKKIIDGNLLAKTLLMINRLDLSEDDKEALNTIGGVIAAILGIALIAILC